MVAVLGMITQCETSRVGNEAVTQNVDVRLKLSFVGLADPGLKIFLKLENIFPLVEFIIVSRRSRVSTFPFVDRSGVLLDDID